VGIEALTHLGHHEAARGPLQQPHAQSLLQLRHALAEARFRHTKRASGGRETGVLDHRGKEVQVVEILQGTSQYRHECFLDGTISSILPILSQHCSKYMLITSAEPLPHWLPTADPDDSAAVLGNEILQQFLDADVLVIGAPMYNFAISSQLKAWIDRVLVAGKTFRYTANGPEGLASGKRVIIASSRGGMYGKDSPAAAMDFQEPYLRAAFAFVGITDLEFIRAEGIAIGDTHKAQALKSARESIDALLAKAA
jgi:FMN-dependent NADH-azoreductase